MAQGQLVGHHFGHCSLFRSSFVRSFAKAAMALTSTATSTSSCLSLSAPVREVSSRLMPAADYPVDGNALDGFLAGCVGCGLGAARDFCQAFSRNEARRDEEVRGLASELAQPVSMDQSVAALFLARAFAHLRGRARSVDAPLAVGAFMVKTRPLYGTWVEEDPFPKRRSSAAGPAVAPSPTPQVAIVGPSLSCGCSDCWCGQPCRLGRGGGGVYYGERGAMLCRRGRPEREPSQ